MLRTRGAIREHYTRWEVGLELWHVFPKRFVGDAFNPHSKSRFSAFAANPSRAMYYAASTPECAIWEVVLRHIVPTGSIVSIDEALYADLQLAHIGLARAVPMLDLRSPNIRHLSADTKQWSEWQRLAVVAEVEYPLTHAAAAELLEVAPRAAGIQWPSRQCVRDAACVLYGPPLLPADFKVLEEIPLNSPAGLTSIDRALRLADLRRAHVGVLAAIAARDLAKSNPNDAESVMPEPDIAEMKR